MSRFFLFLVLHHNWSTTAHNSSTFPGPPHLRPRLHYIPNCLNGKEGGSHDIAAALTLPAALPGAVGHRHNVWQLCPGGWHHAVSTDLVHWHSQGIGPDNWPSGFATVVNDDGSRYEDGNATVCAGMKGTKPIPGAKSWDTPLVLRCSVDGINATQWGPEEPLFDVRFYRFLPYDPFRPFQDEDGLYYVGIALDGCNGTTKASPCGAGGQVDLWSSPALRGKGARWEKVAHGPMFSSNRTIWPRHESEAHEFVTMDYFSVGRRNRVFLSNPYYARGSTEYILGTQGNGSAFVEEARWMLDWGEFKPIDRLATSPTGIRGIDALNRSHSAQPAGGRLAMVRTLGSESPNQVAVPGRRVAVGWISGLGNAMSLPRDLSLLDDDHGAAAAAVAVAAAAAAASDDDDDDDVVVVAETRLRQAFVPELQSLRRGHTKLNTTHPSAKAGQQIEVVARFEGCLEKDFGVSVLGAAASNGVDSERTVVSVLPARDLVCVNGTRQGNPEPRCGPFVRPPAGAPEDLLATLHIIVDHSIVTVIANNVTAITAAVRPSSGSAGGVALETASVEAGGVRASADVWVLHGIDNQATSR